MKGRLHWMQRGNRREERWEGRLDIVGSITNSFQYDLLSPQDCLKEVVSLPPLFATVDTSY